MKRSLVLAAAAAAAALLTATAANAGGVHWSVGINLPPVATVVSSGPAHYPAPAYVAPAYYPEPVYYPEPAYYPTPVYYAPRVYAPRPRVWVAPVVRPFYGAPWGGPARMHDKHPHDGRADWRR
jgi:hypothetical protein